MTWRRGVRLGIDPGTVRIGVARCDPDGMLAVPAETVPRGDGDLARITALAEEYEALELIVGNPTTLSGVDGPAAVAAQDFARQLAGRAGRPVRLVDERMTTAQAQRQLHASGRNTRTSRNVIDMAAAVLLLQATIDNEKTTGEPPGRIVTLT